MTWATQNSDLMKKWYPYEVSFDLNQPSQAWMVCMSPKMIRPSEMAEQWLLENVGQGYLFNGFYQDSQWCYFFERNTTNIEYRFRDSAKAMLFKLTM